MASYKVGLNRRLGARDAVLTVRGEVRRPVLCCSWGSGPKQELVGQFWADLESGVVERPISSPGLGEFICCLGGVRASLGQSGQAKRVGAQAKRVGAQDPAQC